MCVLSRICFRVFASYDFLRATELILAAASGLTGMFLSDQSAMDEKFDEHEQLAVTVWPDWSLPVAAASMLFTAAISTFTLAFK